MIQPTEKLNLLVTCYMEPEYVEQIRQVDPRINVIYEPRLVPTPRFPCDHLGHPLTRTPEEETRWRELLAGADILLDLDKTHLNDLPELAPRVRWIQSTSTGIGPWVKELGYDRRMPDTVITVAGIHGRPLAEFAIMALLMHYKLAGVMARQKQERIFTRFTGTDAAGRTLAILGLGRNGTAVAHMARGIGMRVLGMDLVARPDVVDQFYPREALDEMLTQAEALVIATPGTPLTRGMIGARELALLPKGAYLVNVGRGSIVDESAMIDCLRSGQLSGAGLDVFTQEPLPKDSPFWEMENVLISPHAASISDRENARITELFCDNLRRYLDGKPLRNVLNMELLY
jgi:phosphoglycerate dehydrogenase-like enzyme